MRDWNKWCWSNLVVGILCFSVGSMEESLVIMFIGMFNLLWFGMFWVLKLGLLKRRDAKCTKSEKEICKCGHHTNDHSYLPEELENKNLDCDKCKCKKFVSCVEGEGR